ncbi:MAG: glycoside hydrolase family 2 TIM barrel-domain containing protein [Prevotella sp.]|nr:glycoside hydrolase family 2 TIM barrel-domain containing protein [Prevotella sp.]
MKKQIISTTLLCCAMTLSAAQREVVDMNRGWFFKLGKSQPTVTMAEVADWQRINVPHDFQIEQPWVAPTADEKADNSDAGANIRSRLSSRGFKEMGEGWYVKSFTPSADKKGQRVLLDFQGIMYVGDVYLNGKRIGGTDYGYVGFEIDITKELKYGQENTIAVRCDTGRPKDSRWYTGGGLFRDVKVVYTDPQLYFLRHPLYITTENNNKVNISANVQCNTKQNNVTMQVTITAPDGSVVSDKKYDLKRNRNYRYGQEIAIPAIDLPNAQLWDCEHPNLYTAKVTLYKEDGTVCDEATSRFGVRTIEMVPGKGMLLNGKKVLLKGYANHHTLGALGAAAYPRAIEKRIKMMKEFGLNHIRSSHNPYSESFLDICDENGILFVDELYDKWNDQYVGAGRAHFRDLWQDHVEEFIKRDRNHPCVVMWSLGNELQSYNDQPFNDFGVTQFKLMKTLIQRYDNTRKVTVAMHPRYRNWETDSLPCDLAMATDIQAYNYRYMYFPGDGKRFPWMNFYQSEASVSAMGENFFAMDRDKVIGMAYWGAIDYLGESQGWPAKGWVQGVFDISLEPKPKAYYMKSFFKDDEPLVHIAVTEDAGGVMWNGVQIGNEGQSDHWNRKAGDTLSITTYTNADEVELFVNGKSYGTKKNDKASAKMRNQIRWNNVIYQNGYCEAVARTDGKVVARHKIETTGKPVALKIDTDNANWKADGIDLQHLRIYAVDSKGRRVYTAVGDVKVEVNSKAATLVAMGSGNQMSDELHVTNHRMLYNGSVQAILRSGIDGGDVNITATCDGLKPAKIKLKVKP